MLSAVPWVLTFLVPAKMVFDWADDVEASIESGELPDFAPKNYIRKHDVAQQQAIDISIMPAVFLSVEEPKTTIQRDPDWYNKRSWRAKEEAAPAVLAQSTSATVTIVNRLERGQDDVLNATLDMVRPGSPAESKASRADSIKIANQASTPLSTPPIIITGEDSVKQEDPYFSNPFWNPEIKVRKVIVVSSDPIVNDIRRILWRSTRPGEALDLRI